MVRHRDFPKDHPPQQEPPVDLCDIDLLRSLWLLTDGKPADFCDTSDPPADVMHFITHTDAHHIRGLIIVLLRRWHQLKRNKNKP